MKIYYEIIGIDPGRSNGGIAIYKDEQYSSIKLSSFKERTDMLDYFLNVSKTFKNPIIFIEKITTFQSDKEGGKFFRMDKLKAHYESLLFAIEASKIDYIEVMPRSWMRYLNLYSIGEDRERRKKRLKNHALSVIPAPKIVAWNADAYLLVLFGFNKLKNDRRWVEDKKHKYKSI